MHTPTAAEVQKMQGTRKRADVAPWETYGKQMDADPEMTPQLQAEMEAYAQRRHDKSSSQNEEELARWKEHNQDIAKEYQWVTPDEYADAGARIGRIMHSSEFINILRKAGVKCWYRDHPQPRKITLVVKREGLEPEVGCWVQYGHAPELSVMSFDDHGVPLAEKYRGWRTCLLQLIMKGIITEDSAHKHFGMPGMTPAFHRYNQMLQDFRRAGSRLAE